MLVKFPESLLFAGETPREAGPGASPADNAFAVFGLLKAKGLDKDGGVATGVPSVWPGTYGSVVFRAGGRFPCRLESGPFEAVRGRGGGGGGGRDETSAGTWETSTAPGPLGEARLRMC